MFDSAKDIMQWLSLCAQVVAKADKPVHWTTPLGLPVVQPYRKKVCPALPCPAWNPQSLHLFDPAYHCVHCCWYLSQVASALETLYKPILGCVRATSAFSALFCLLFFEALLSMLQSIAVAWLACGLATEADRSFLPSFITRLCLR